MSLGIDILPEYLLDPKKLEEFIGWLITMPFDLMYKKQLFIEWCKYLGVAYTEEMIERIVGTGYDDYLRG
jgi:hypothetical protein